MTSFETRVFGKWILAGEHSVLRGSPALVFPLYSRFLDFKFLNSESATELTAEIVGGQGEEMEVLFWKVIDRACELANIKRDQIKGHLKLSSSIPVGAGLGASAALCVAIGRWFQRMNLISEAEIYEFARTLEDQFHGESSGVDIAVALSGRGLRFVRDGERREIHSKWTPHWYVSYSGSRAVTSTCVAQVKTLLGTSPKLGQQIDQDMMASVEMAELALSLPEKEGVHLLAKAIQLGASCFERWELTPKKHTDWLEAAGALATKPTGSGGGGFVLSLWAGVPPSDLKNLLVPCFSTVFKESSVGLTL